MLGERFEKIYQAFFKDFPKKKQPIIQNYPTFAIVVIARKKSSSRKSRETKLTEFSQRKDMLNTHFDNYLIKFHQSSICFYHYLSFLFKNYGLKLFAFYTKQTYRFFFFNLVYLICKLPKF